jgi:hypothetical protein
MTVPGGPLVGASTTDATNSGAALAIVPGCVLKSPGSKLSNKNSLIEILNLLGVFLFIFEHLSSFLIWKEPAYGNHLKGRYFKYQAFFA